MARNKIDECLFCESLPCVCGKPKNPSKPKRAAAAEPASNSSVPRAVRPPRSPRPAASDGNDVQKLPVKIPNRAAPSSVPQPTRAAVREIRSQEETDLRMALTALADAGLLCADDLEANRKLIDLPSWKVDALIWRQRGPAAKRSVAA